MADCMSNPLVKMADGDLRELATALRSARVAPPFTAFAVQRFVSQHIAQEAAETLQALCRQGFSGTQIAAVVELILEDRAQRATADDLIDLVTTGPEVRAVSNRDTRVVVRELFACAEESVLVVGYAVYKGKQVFQSLADRMAIIPQLKVQLLLDVGRRQGDTSASGELVRRFADRFKQFDWPHDRPMPEVYYFPLSQEIDPETRAVLHAKCIVVDRRRVFVGSANFTEAAQNRNIEVGLLIESGSLAGRISTHFQGLLADNVLLRAL